MEGPTPAACLFHTKSMNAQFQFAFFIIMYGAVLSCQVFEEVLHEFRFIFHFTSTNGLCLQYKSTT